MTSPPDRPPWAAECANEIPVCGWSTSLRGAVGSILFPDSPSRRGLRGYPAQAQRPGGGGEASHPPFPGELPVLRGPARALRWRLLTTPFEPIPVRHQLHSLDRRTETKASPRKRGSSTPAPAQRAH